MDSICRTIIIIGLALFVILFPIAFLTSEKDKIKQKLKRINMKSRQEYILNFENLYSQLCGVNLDSLLFYKSKLKVIMSIFVCIIVISFAFFAVVASFDLNLSIMGSYILPSIVLMVLVLPLYYYYKKLNKQYSLEYKKTILECFLKLVNETFVFKDVTDDDIAVERTYKQINFPMEKYDKLVADDYVSGIVDNCFFELADIVVSEQVQIDGKNREHIKFKGLFATMELEKKIPTEVEIRKINKNIVDKVYMKIYEYQKFENDINIYSNDIALVNNLVSAGLITLLNEYYEQFGYVFEIILKESKMYIRFYSEEMFEPMIFLDILDKDLLYFYYVSVLLIADFCKDLKRVIDNTSL